MKRSCSWLTDDGLRLLTGVNNIIYNDGSYCLASHQFMTIVLGIVSCGLSRHFFCLISMNSK